MSAYISFNLGSIFLISPDAERLQIKNLVKIKMKNGENLVTNLYLREFIILSINLKFQNLVRAFTTRLEDNPIYSPDHLQSGLSI